MIMKEFSSIKYYNPPYLLLLRGWWMYWRDWRALERAARRFRDSKARAILADRAEHINLLSLDEEAFEDIMQELCQVRNYDFLRLPGDPGEIRLALTAVGVQKKMSTDHHSQESHCLLFLKRTLAWILYTLCDCDNQKVMSLLTYYFRTVPT